MPPTTVYYINNSHDETLFSPDTHERYHEGPLFYIKDILLSWPAFQYTVDIPLH